LWVNTIDVSRGIDALKAFGQKLLRRRERVSIELYPERVVAVRLDHKGQTMLRRTAAVEVPVAETPSGRNVVAALESLLAGSDFKNAQADVLLSNHFLRYTVLPWREDVTGEAERLALARHSLNKIYGMRAEDWEVRVSLGDYGRASVAVAVAPDLLAAIKSVSRTATLALERIEPLLVAGFNRACQGVPGKNFWFVSVEAASACVARLGNGQWQSVRCHRIGQDWVRELVPLLARESLWDEVPVVGLPVIVHAPNPSGVGFSVYRWTPSGIEPFVDGATPTANPVPIAKPVAEVSS
jgi:hypothetical protein